MKIIRDGKEIELTAEEIESTYREQELCYHMEDVRMQWCVRYTQQFPYEDDIAKHIAERAINIMSKNDGYWDYYWENFDAAIDEFKKDSGCVDDKTGSWFEVWALGYNSDGTVNDYEELLGRFDDTDAAIEHAKGFKDVSYLHELGTIEELEEGEYITIRVEEVQHTADGNGTEAIDILYEQDI